MSSYILTILTTSIILYGHGTKQTMKSCKQLNQFLYTHHIDYFKTNTATLKVAGGTETISAKRDSREEAHRDVNDRQVRRERQALCPATAEHGFLWDKNKTPAFVANGANESRQRTTKRWVVNVAGNYNGKVVNHSFHSAYRLLVPSLSALLPSLCVCVWGGGVSSVQVSSVQFSSVPDGIYVLGKAHMRSIPCLRSFAQRRL